MFFIVSQVTDNKLDTIFAILIYLNNVMQQIIIKFISLRNAHAPWNLGHPVYIIKYVKRMKIRFK